MSRLLMLPALLVLVSMLGGCGSGSDSDDPRRVNTDYSNLTLAEPPVDPVSNEHNAQSFATYLRNGMRLQVRSGNAGNLNGDAGAPEAVSDSAGSGSGNFSRTNVHVEGVDEADRVKYDGSQLYIAKSPYYTYHWFAGRTDIAGNSGGAGLPEQSQGIRILTTDPGQAQATEIAEISLNESDSNSALSQLYLHADEQGQTRDLVAISNVHQPMAEGELTILPYYYHYRSGTRLDLFDVTSPGNPNLSQTLELDGSLVNSRQIGSLLYLVTSHFPEIDGLRPFPANQAERDENERLIASTPIRKLLPQYQIDGGEPRPLVEEGDCFLPKDIQEHEGYANLIAVSAFDLRNGELVSSVCLNSHVSGLYASTTSLYLGTTRGGWSTRETGLHKFSLENGQIRYQGAGKVPGSLNWVDPSFSMDEQGEYLRVVSTQQGDGIKHQLNVLKAQEGSDQLVRVATLPNEDQPAAIGKPGESIYAVRFLGERAYIVTFEQIDPLYVLDLSDNESPVIAGELEIPGLSTYLHPAGDGYLVSVGQDATEEGIVEGVKIELFDVRDIANPQSLGVDIVGGLGSWSEALYDLRAFNALVVNDDQLRFTLPITRREEYLWLDSGLFIYQVTGLSGDIAELEPMGSIVVEENEAQDNFYGPARAGNGRSRLHDDTLFYVHGNDVWSSFWDAPEQVNGPF